MKTFPGIDMKIRFRPRILLASVAVLVPLALTACFTDSAPAPPRGIFVTSQSYTGSFGGVNAADSICGTLAQAAALGGRWTSFLSDSAAGALGRVREAGPWFRIEANGFRSTKLFNNRTGFIVGALATINDEYGRSVANTVRVWTGTRADGGTDGTQTCSDWSETTGYATDGNPNALIANGPKWMHSGEGAAPCNQLKRLYCIEH